MPTVRLRIDVSGTIGEEAWLNLRPFCLADHSSFDLRQGSGAACKHAPDAPHLPGEWIDATIHVKTMLEAQYALAHYQEQDRVLEANVEED